MPAVLVIADDVTGANATGALFARLGLRTRVLAAGSWNELAPGPWNELAPGPWNELAPGSWNEPPGPGTDVMVVTTGSRHLPAAAAADRVRRVLATGAGDDAQLLVKRVDTTLRGPIGPELAVMLAHRRARCAGRVAALAVPAYPAAGRTTVGGIHLLRGTPLARSPVASDPVTPVVHSRVADLMVAGTALTAAEVHLDVLDGDDHAVARALAAALRAADVAVADAATDADLARLAAAVALVRPRLGEILVVDSGPFGAACCRELGITGRAARRPVLVVVGSPAETTRVQVEAARREAAAHITMVGEHLDPGEAAAGVVAAVDAGAAAAGWHVPPLRPGADLAWADQVTSALAEAARRVLAERRMAGVFACGGEVAAAVLGALGAQGVDIITEVQPLVVAGRVIGGPFGRLPVITKGGLAGDENAITASIGHLHSMQEAPLGTIEDREVAR